MDRQTVIQNILTNYGQYGITQETIEPLIDTGEKMGLTKDIITLKNQTAENMIQIGCKLIEAKKRLSHIKW